MTLTSWAVLLYIPFVLASSLPVLPTFDNTSIPALDVNDSPSSTITGTVWDIIWICAETLIACTWTAIHPNILGEDEGNFPSPIYHGNGSGLPGTHHLLGHIAVSSALVKLPGALMMPSVHNSPRSMATIRA
ncbi:hypothetical protein M405DRAFT_885778 [Rhizopogon salebrosus TDB-379]|nr:hypothetical protein M405DRAFT_885778 [Rhizopogon salebrosus TDB-379]